MRGVSTLIRQRFTVRDLVPVLFGAPLPGRKTGGMGPPEPAPSPTWISELDEYESSEMLTLAFSGELSDVLAARIGETVDGDRSPIRHHACRSDRGGRHRVPGGLARRRACPRNR